MWVSGIIYYEYYFNFWCLHDDVMKWKHFPRYWPFVRWIHRSPVNSPHKGQWRGALMFSLICVWINGWVNNREAGDLRRYCAHYGVIVMSGWSVSKWCCHCGDRQSLVRFCDSCDLLCLRLGTVPVFTIHFDGLNFSNTNMDKGQILWNISCRPSDVGQKDLNRHHWGTRTNTYMHVTVWVCICVCALMHGSHNTLRVWRLWLYRGLWPRSFGQSVDLIEMMCKVEWKTVRD